MDDLYDRLTEKADDERLNARNCPICGNPQCPTLRWVPELGRYGLCPKVDYGCKPPDLTNV